jgi:hypothetical protein
MKRIHATGSISDSKKICRGQVLNAATHKFYNTDCEARLNFVDWCLLGMQHTEIDVILIPHSGENCFQFSENMKL